jgi:hypothetical protein
VIQVLRNTRWLFGTVSLLLLLLLLQVRLCNIMRSPGSATLLSCAQCAEHVLVANLWSVTMLLLQVCLCSIMRIQESATAMQRCSMQNVWHVVQLAWC